MLRSVLEPAGANPTLTVAFAPGLAYQKRYHTAWRGTRLPERLPSAAMVIAVLALWPVSGPTVGVGVGVAALGFSALVGWMEPTKPTLPTGLVLTTCSSTSR